MKKRTHNGIVPLDRKGWAGFAAKYSEHGVDRYITVGVILTTLVGAQES
jgi:hypothetical protein